MGRICRILVTLCLLATATSTLRVYPHQLACFNEIAGGPENGWKHLLGSNLDWGQDLFVLEQCVHDLQLDFATVGLVVNTNASGLVAKFPRVHEHDLRVTAPAPCCYLVSVNQRTGPRMIHLDGETNLVERQICPTHFLVSAR